MVFGQKMASLNHISFACQDKTNSKKSVVREYEDVMQMLREVIMYQYEQSPNAVAFFRMQGPASRIDPLQRLTEVCTPDSLDHVCNIFEAYRSVATHYVLLHERKTQTMQR